MVTLPPSDGTYNQSNDKKRVQRKTSKYTTRNVNWPGQKAEGIINANLIDLCPSEKRI